MSSLFPPFRRGGMGREYRPCIQVRLAPPCGNPSHKERAASRAEEWRDRIVYLPF